MLVLMLSFVLFLCPAISANSYPLSDSSKQTIAISAGVAGMISGVIGYAVYQNNQEIEEQPKDQTFWQKVKAFPWAATLIPAALGAAVVGLIAYKYTPEKTLEWAENELISIENDIVLRTAMSTEELHELRQLYARNTFPNLSTVNRLSYLYNWISSVKRNLVKVMQSGIRPLVQIAQKCMHHIEKYEQRLLELISRFKNNSHYLQELDMQSRIQYRTAMAAAAAQRANAAMIHATRPRPPVVIIHRP